MEIQFGTANRIGRTRYDDALPIGYCPVRMGEFHGYGLFFLFLRFIFSSRRGHFDSGVVCLSNSKITQFATLWKPR